MYMYTSAANAFYRQNEEKIKRSFHMSMLIWNDYPKDVSNIRISSWKYSIRWNQYRIFTKEYMFYIPPISS